MASKDRKRQLVQRRYRYQQARREAEARKARRIRLLGSAVAVALVAGGGFGIVSLVGGDEDAQADPAASAPPPEEGRPKQEIALQKVSISGEKGSGSATCKYPDSDDKDAPKGLGKPPAKAVYDGKVTATVNTSLGDVKLELDAGKAPCTVNSFAYLAEKKFFENTKCHRLTASASLKVLQCGDPTGTGSGGPGYRFANENTKGAKYTRGVVAMAHSIQPDSNGSQFFIVYDDSELPADYTIFGKVTSGMDVIDKVAKAGVAA